MTLSPMTRKLIAARMQRGGYASAEETVRAALASLEQQQSAGEFEPGELRRLLEEGENSGPSIDGKRVFRELRELRTKRRRAAK
jgi:putative addiction module CopG family antidote